MIPIEYQPDANMSLPLTEPRMSAEPRTFGLVAGLGVGAGIFYYKALVEAHLDLGLSARLVMVHADVRRVLAHVAAHEVNGLATYLAELLSQLVAAGAKIATIPAFSPQVCAAQLAAISPLPLVNLVDVISAEVERRKLWRVSLFGAPATMRTKLFGALQGAEVIMPAPQEVDLIGRIYTQIVEKAGASEEEHSLLRALAHAIINRDGVEAIILAGTDLALVFNPANTDLASVSKLAMELCA
jgi:aspartate racemase